MCLQKAPRVPVRGGLAMTTLRAAGFAVETRIPMTLVRIPSFLTPLSALGSLFRPQNPLKIDNQQLKTDIERRNAR
jgi:hypothetical protein